MIVIVMVALVAMSLVSAKMALTISYPENQIEQTDISTERLIADTQRLARIKNEIDQMPEGFEKLDAQRDWFREVDQLLAITKPANVSHSNIVHLYKLRH